MYTLATTLDAAIDACTAEEPLQPGDARYLDLSSARGESTRKIIERMLRVRSADSAPIKVLFFSHRGSGKSTELLKLQGDLESTNRYRCLYLEANLEMNATSIESEDLFLTLARAVHDFMVTADLPVPEEKLERVTRWFESIVKTTLWGQTLSIEQGLSMKGGAESKRSLLGSLLAHVTAINKHESAHRIEVKRVFQQYPNALLDAVNDLFDLANQLLRFHNRGELLVVIDNLDRYAPSVIDKLLLQKADRIESLRCNLILTPPISLHYRPESSSPREIYDCEVMPAVKLHERTDPYGALSDSTYELLQMALGKRIHLDLIAGEDARRRLILASGGAMRDLLKLFVAAALRASEDKLTLKDIERAVVVRRSEMRDLVNANGWAETLAGIAKRKQINEDNACQDVLYQRLAFKYNGEVWYDIHPLVAEIPEVKQLIEKPPRVVAP